MDTLTQAAKRLESQAFLAALSTLHWFGIRSSGPRESGVTSVGVVGPCQSILIGTTHVDRLHLTVLSWSSAIVLWWWHFVGSDEVERVSEVPWRPMTNPGQSIYVPVRWSWHSQTASCTCSTGQQGHHWLLWQQKKQKSLVSGQHANPQVPVSRYLRIFERWMILKEWWAPPPL